MTENLLRSLKPTREHQNIYRDGLEIRVSAREREGGQEDRGNGRTFVSNAHISPWIGLNLA